MALLVALLSLGIAALGYELFYMHWLREVVADGRRALLYTSAASLDRDIRARLPAGSSRVAVETALRSRHVDYRFIAPDEIDGVARHLKGSDPLVERTLSLRFHFDDRYALTRIDSEVMKPGP